MTPNLPGHRMQHAAASTDHLTCVKIVVAGLAGPALTRFVAAICDVGPLTTWAVVDAAENPPAAPDTVAVSVGRITVNDALILYLFGTSGRQRARPVWDELCDGAIGAIVLADTRRPAHHAAAMQHVDAQRLPYVVALNRLADDLGSTRVALRLPDHVPLLACDTRDRGQVRQTLIALVEHVLSQPYPATPTTVTG
jgi:signal recognition particle receptor subunit beta